MCEKALLEAQQLYIQALAYCLMGDTATADRLLQRLGCQWRLSAAAWAAAGAGGATSSTQGASRRTQDAAATAAATVIQPPTQLQRVKDHQQQDQHNPVFVHAQPLPAPLLQALQEAFHSNSSDYWQQHCYDEPETPFFSYLFDLQAAAAAAAAGAPANALEVAALMLHNQLRNMAPATALAQSASSAASAAAIVAGQPQCCNSSSCCRCSYSPQPTAPADAAAIAAAAAQATHIEWWAHTRPAWAPHQLHFDAAEGAFRRGLQQYSLHHPLLSSVMYLNDCGGPTLVLNQDIGGLWRGWGGDSCQQQQQQQQLGEELPGHSGSITANNSGCCTPVDGSETSTQVQCAALKRRRVAVNITKQQQQQHHQEQQQQHSVEPLGSHAWCIAPAAGRVAVWPGCLLHGVLPAQPVPLKDDVTSDSNIGRGATTPAAHTASPPTAETAAAEAATSMRTTLIMAWWKGDPRSLAAPDILASTMAADAEVHAADQDATTASPPSAPAITSHSHVLHSCMLMPSLATNSYNQDLSGSSSGSSAPRWLQALCSLPQKKLADLLAAAATSAAVAAAAKDQFAKHQCLCSCNGWRMLPSCSPAWEPVMQQGHQATMAQATSAVKQHAEADAQVWNGGLPTHNVVSTWQHYHHQQQHSGRASELGEVQLPCLRFFLRDSREVQNAYVPSNAHASP